MAWQVGIQKQLGAVMSGLVASAADRWRGCFLFTDWGIPEMRMKWLS
jgi:hypothetical protein